MAEVRITKAMRFATLRGVVIDAVQNDLLDGDEANALVAFIDHECDLLDRKHSAKSGKTPNQAINDGIKNSIVDLLTDEGVPMTATEIAVRESKTVQKVTSLVKQLVDEGRVERIEGKGKTKTTFTIK